MSLSNEFYILTVLYVINVSVNQMSNLLPNANVQNLKASPTLPEYVGDIDTYRL